MMILWSYFHSSSTPPKKLHTHVFPSLTVKLLWKGFLCCGILGQRYDFTVNEKKFPLVPKLMELIESYGFKTNRSKIICQALTEYYYRRKDYLDHNTSMGFGRTKEDDEDDAFYTIEYMHESVLPSIAEPISSFDFEKNRDMYYFMTKEMRGHIDRVTGTLTDAVKKANKEFPTAYHTTERNYSIHELILEWLKRNKPSSSSSWSSLDDDEARRRRKTVYSLIQKRLREDDERLKDFIRQRAMQPYRDARQWRRERIAELQEELHRLTEQEQYENLQQQQTKEEVEPQKNLVEK